jgi:hypothetical protein
VTVRPGLAPVSPFLVGGVISVAGMTGGGLLLNQGTGLLRAAVSILALQCGALAAGTWAASPDGGDTQDEVLRGWWVASFMTLTLAAGLTAWWQLRGLPQIPLARGVVLGVLVGLPQVALGGVVALVARGRSGPTLVLSGAAAGFVVAGVALLPLLGPVTVYFLCVAALALAAAMEATAVEGAPMEASAVEGTRVDATAVTPPFLDATAIAPALLDAPAPSAPLGTGLLSATLSEAAALDGGLAVEATGFRATPLDLAAPPPSVQAPALPGFSGEPAP